MRAGNYVSDHRGFVSWPQQRFPLVDSWLDHPDWSGKDVLDFGGNVGNLLREAPIERSRYWCLDVSAAAIEEGRRRHPDAHWVFYDRYNFQFNPDGQRDLGIPDLGRRFDYVVCFSVFTHTTPREMIETVGQLRAMLAPGGTLAFTFADHLWHPPDSPTTPLTIRLEVPGRQADPGLDIGAVTAAVQDSAWCSLIADREIHPESDGMRSTLPAGTSYHVFYRPAHVRALFPDARIRPPVSPHFQHCCLLGG